jgi:hypothetical protein
MMQSSSVVIAVVASLSFFSSPARADDVTRAGERAGYRYVFKDDPLQAGGLDAKDARIRVMPRALRQTLIRPRTTFVTEMLESIEKL